MRTTKAFDCWIAVSPGGVPQIDTLKEQAEDVMRRAICIVADMKGRDDVIWHDLASEGWTVRSAMVLVGE